VAKLDQLAYEISQQVNGLHSTGYNPAGATGIDFFTPLGSATDAARQLSLGANIVASVNNIAAAKTSTGTDNQIATSVGNLLHSQSFSGGSVIDQYRSLIFQIGTDTAGSRAKLDQYAALHHQLQDRRDSTSGVSVDEETMRIPQFQRSCQASANVIRVVDELMQTLLGMVR
jgi:flagellar hook-associated protein 1 FlgK